MEEYLPGIDIVFDRFHVMQLVNRVLDGVRKGQQKHLSKHGSKALKGNRFLIMSNYMDLDNIERRRVDQLLLANKPIMIMHTMKEQLRLLWNQKNRNQGAAFLLTWALDAYKACDDYELESGSKALEPLRRLTHSMINHSDGILNYFNHRVTSGKIEGINNKIKTLKRQAYGYRDMEYFQLRLLHLHAQKSRLSG